MLEIVTRKAWRAMPSQWDLAPMNRPARALWIIYAGGEECRDREECDHVMRELQRYHIEKQGQPDLPFSFIIGFDGRAYEARGWGYSAPEPYNHPELLDTRYIFAFLGTDFVYPHNDICNITMKALIEYGMHHGWLAEDFMYYQWDDVPYKIPPIDGWKRPPDNLRDQYLKIKV